MATPSPLEVGWDHTDPLRVYGSIRAVPEGRKGWHTSPRDYNSPDTDRRLTGERFGSRDDVRGWLLDEEPRMGPLADFGLVFILRRSHQLTEAERLRQSIWVDREGNQVYPSTAQLRRHPRRARGERSTKELGWRRVPGPETQRFYQVGIHNAS